MCLWRWIVRWCPGYSSHPLVLAEDGGYTHWLWTRETCLSSDHCLFDTWLCLTSGWLSLSLRTPTVTLACWQCWPHGQSKYKNTHEAPTDLYWASQCSLDNRCLFHTHSNLAVGTIRVLMQKSLLREMKWCPQGLTAGKGQVEEAVFRLRSLAPVLGTCHQLDVAQKVLSTEPGP